MNSLSTLDNVDIAHNLRRSSGRFYRLSRYALSRNTRSLIDIRSQRRSRNRVRPPFCSRGPNQLNLLRLAWRASLSVYLCVWLVRRRCATFSPYLSLTLNASHQEHESLEESASFEQGYLFTYLLISIHTFTQNLYSFTNMKRRQKSLEQ